MGIETRRSFPSTYNQKNALLTSNAIKWHSKGTCSGTGTPYASAFVMLKMRNLISQRSYIFPDTDLDETFEGGGNRGNIVQS